MKRSTFIKSLVAIPFIPYVFRDGSPEQSGRIELGRFEYFEPLRSMNLLYDDWGPKMPSGFILAERPDGFSVRWYVE